MTISFIKHMFRIPCIWPFDPILETIDSSTSVLTKYVVMTACITVRFYVNDSSSSPMQSLSLYCWCAVSVFALSGAEGTDPCTKLFGLRTENRYFATSADMDACFALQPVDTASAVQTVRNYLSMYSYHDVLRNYTAVPRFASHVNLDAELSQLPTEGISEHTFHT